MLATVRDAHRADARACRGFDARQGLSGFLCCAGVDVSLTRERLVRNDRTQRENEIVAMPKPLKFPGLQRKFERALLVILGNEDLGGAEILGRLTDRAAEFEVASQELTDLHKNFANYVERAKTAEVISSGGPWTGYHLTPIAPAASASAGAIPVEERALRRPNEGAMHLVATCALSIHFGARVMSLPTTVDLVAWGNADMLMLRGNPSRQRLEDSNLDPEILKLADSSPECILSSVELKYGLERNRRLWFQAVAEAAANSRWANESFLVHVSPEAVPGALDDEVVSLARSAEIGILEISVLSHETQNSLQTRTIVAAPQRPFLRLAELSGNRAGLLQEAHALLRCWNEPVVTFLDEDGAPLKLVRLLRQALQNLKRQASFGLKPLKEALASVGSDARVPALFAAALDTIATTTDAALNWEKAAPILSQVDSLTKKQWDELAADLDALTKFIKPVTP
jgi:hypothetical protein